MTVTADEFWGGGRYVDASAFAPGSNPALRVNRELAAVYRVKNTNALNPVSMVLPAMPAPWRDGPFYCLIYNEGPVTLGVVASGGGSVASITAGHAAVVHRRGDLPASGASGWFASVFAASTGSGAAVAMSAGSLPAAPPAPGAPSAVICSYFELVDECSGVFPTLFTYTGYTDGTLTQADLSEYVGRVIRVELEEGESPSTGDLASYRVRRRYYAGGSITWTVVPVASIVTSGSGCAGIVPPPPPTCGNAGASCTPVSCDGSVLSASTACAGPVVACPTSPLYSALLALEPDGVWDTREAFEVDFAAARGASETLEFCGCRFEYRNSARSGGGVGCDSRRVLCYRQTEYAECWVMGALELLPNSVPSGCPGGRLECCCAG